MVTCRSPKPFLRVRVLLPLPKNKQCFCIAFLFCEGSNPERAKSVKKISRWLVFSFLVRRPYKCEALRSSRSDAQRLCPSTPAKKTSDASALLFCFVKARTLRGQSKKGVFEKQNTHLLKSIIYYLFS